MVQHSHPPLHEEYVHCARRRWPARLTSLHECRLRLGLHALAMDEALRQEQGEACYLLEHDPLAFDPNYHPSAFFNLGTSNRRPVLQLDRAVRGSGDPRFVASVVRLQGWRVLVA